MRADGASSIGARAAATSAAADRSPAAYSASAAASPRERLRAWTRSSAERYALRDDIATPSVSRRIGMPTISMPKSRSRTMRWMIASCW